MAAARDAWLRVFAPFSVGSLPFNRHNPRIESACVLFEIYGCGLTERQFAAIARAAHDLGEEWAWGVNMPDLGLDWLWSDQGDQDVRRVGLDADGHDELNAPDLFAERCLFSSRGTWGIVMTDEDYAVVGGPAEFVDTIERLCPVDRDAVYNHVAGAYKAGEWIVALFAAMDRLRERKRD